LPFPGALGLTAKPATPALKKVTEFEADLFHIKNKVQLISYLGKTPEHKTAKKTGRTFAILSLATQSTWKDANEEWQRRVEWHRLIVIWNLRLRQTAA
jgi:hypothetical protein